LGESCNWFRFSKRMSKGHFAKTRGKLNLGSVIDILIAEENDFPLQEGFTDFLYLIVIERLGKIYTTDFCADETSSSIDLNMLIAHEILQNLII
jgi:hypothetical protein